MHRAGDVTGVIEQNVLIRFDDPDSVILKMLLQPISLHQRFWVRVFSWVSSHKKVCDLSHHRARDFALYYGANRGFRGAHASGVTATPNLLCESRSSEQSKIRVNAGGRKVRRRRMRRPARCKRARPGTGHFKIESAEYTTPFLMTLSISDAFFMSSNGFELRITRSAKQPFSSLPIWAPVSPPKSFAAFAVVHCNICIGVSPASFIN